jgi:hypothetical protein
MSALRAASLRSNTAEKWTLSSLELPGGIAKITEERQGNRFPFFLLSLLLPFALDKMAVKEICGLYRSFRHLHGTTKQKRSSAVQAYSSLEIAKSSSGIKFAHWPFKREKSKKKKKTGRCPKRERERASFVRLSHRGEGSLALSQSHFSGGTTFLFYLR